MIFVTVLVLTLLALRLFAWPHEASTPLPGVVIAVIVAVLVSVGASIGGSLVYDYGFNIETAGDHPVWHRSETDVSPGQHS